jgi:GNAT superfamily N-acetyltransferase
VRTEVALGQVDPRDGPPFDEWFAVLRATDLERWPDGPGWQRAERLAQALDQEGPVEHRCLVARSARRVVGIADLEMFRRENRHVARIDVRVLPEHRRRGVGTALVEGAGRTARAAGRTELGGMDETPIREGYVDRAEPFARHLGFSVALRMVRRRLRVPLEPQLGARVRGRLGGAPPPGYSLLTFGDRWPDEYLADRCELGRRMSTDVPVGTQELDEEDWDEGRVRALEAGLAAQHRAKVTTVARHDTSGRLVGYTEVVVPLGAPASSWQHDTLVMREHRGHGLGLAMKLANVDAVVERHPDVRTISTWNAAENAPMIAVNDEMGCEVAATARLWQKRLATQ